MANNDKIQVIHEVEKALDDILFGSVELFLQDGEVTQITVKRIQKTGVKYGVATQKNNHKSSDYKLSQKKSSKTDKSSLRAKLGA